MTQSPSATHVIVPRRGVFVLTERCTDVQYGIPVALWRGHFLDTKLEASFLESAMAKNNIREPAAAKALEDALSLLDTVRVAKGGLANWQRVRKVYLEKLNQGRPKDNAFVLRELFSPNGRTAAESSELYDDALRCLSSECALVFRETLQASIQKITNRLLSVHLASIAPMS